VDLNHSTEAALHAYDGGLMDGFSAAQAFYNLPDNLAMGYYDGSDLPEYYNLASEYVLAQRFFSSAWGSSAINHMYTIAARGGGTMPTTGYDFPTIFDRLQAAGVSWKFYVQNYDPSINFRTAATGNTSKESQLIWDPLANFARFVDDPTLSSHIVDMQQYYADLQAGKLPAVSYLVPSGLSEHPPGDITVGQSFGITTVTSLMRSSAWDSSVFVESWDDWGGWYDHVPPPQVDADGYGFRVPGIIVSPYARDGNIDNTTYDFTSILKFIEDNWSIQPLTARDATANSIADALDLSRPPSPPVFPGQTWPAQSTGEAANRSILLAIYAAVVAVAVICGAFLIRPWQRQATRHA
jgi:phospholipase C